MVFSNILIELNTTYILLREIYRNLAVGLFLTSRHLFSPTTRQKDSKYLSAKQISSHKQFQIMVLEHNNVDYN